MKQVTLDAPKSCPLGESHKLDAPRGNLPVHRGIAMPKGMVSQGQEGYRTPTVEDYERHHCEYGSEENPMGGLSSRCSQVHLTPHSPGFFVRYAQNVRFLEDLEWRERIRHFTWVCLLI